MSNSSQATLMAPRWRSRRCACTFGNSVANWTVSSFTGGPSRHEPHAAHTPGLPHQLDLDALTRGDPGSVEDSDDEAVEALGQGALLRRGHLGELRDRGGLDHVGLGGLWLAAGLSGGEVFHQGLSGP
jgi:hypothetical protein